MMVPPNHPTLDYEIVLNSVTKLDLQIIKLMSVSNKNDDGHRCPGAPYWHLWIVLQNAHHRLGAAATNHFPHLR